MLSFKVASISQTAMHGANKAGNNYVMCYHSSKLEDDISGRMDENLQVESIVRLTIQYHGLSETKLIKSIQCHGCSFAEPIDGGSSPLTNEKNATLLVPKPIQFALGSGFEGGQGNTISHYAMWHTKTGNFHGLRAEMNVWGLPNQQSSQDSGAAIQIYCQDGGRYSLIEVGFHVSPSLYHNRDVRFFTYSTKDTKSAGCYNLECLGFVPAKGASMVPGQAVASTSIYGEADRYVRLSLNEDPNSGDWVVYRHDLGTPSFFGHFPKNLCPTTSRIQALTGFVNYLNTTSGPPMGSGHFPEGNADLKKSAYFKHIKIYDSEGHARDPITTTFHDLVDKPDCYRVSDFFYDFEKGYIFFYGGPGGCVG